MVPCAKLFPYRAAASCKDLQDAWEARAQLGVHIFSKPQTSERWAATERREESEQQAPEAANAVHPSKSSESAHTDRKPVLRPYFLNLKP